MLAAGGRIELSKTRVILAQFVDAVANLDGDLADGLEKMRVAWLNSVDPTTGPDWRWYVVKYEAMREGASGLYVGLHGALGYQLCMLNKTQMNSCYRDPFLLAILRESGAEAEIAEQNRWFTGYETEAR